jgi:hydroxymethylpyrimidine pyrophosphatase-like HAD family hydrolase
MEKSFRAISRELANSISLIMTDVDGTLLATGRKVSGPVAESLKALKVAGIVTGLVSGRTLPELESMAEELDLRGPIIAENGAVAKLTPGEACLELGYTREAALKALQKLKSLYPGSIHEREDNKERTIDIVFRADGIPLDEMRRHIGKTQLLDSGYILHLMQGGVSKGNTLRRLLGEYLNGEYSVNNVLVFGDSVTDISLFELFPYNVLILNPGLPDGQMEIMREKAAYISEKCCGEGFEEVALHITRLRNDN